MASLADVFTEKERTNWLKTWLAVDIAKSGLEPFVEKEAKILHTSIYNTVCSRLPEGVVCIDCNIANLLKCPTPGICNKKGKLSTCTSMHNTKPKQPRPCPLSICDKVLDEISKEHRFSKPSWKNTSANDWASNPWQIAKAYLPPDGYAGKSSVHDTDFNGVVSFIMNCKHFDSKFSFTIAPKSPSPPCLLTKARAVGKAVRHSSIMKVSDTDLQDYFTTLNDLLSDGTCLAHDNEAKAAVSKLALLEKDTFDEILKKHLKNAADKSLSEIMENIKTKIGEYLDKCKQDIDEHAGKHKQDIEKHAGKHKQDIDEHADKNKQDIDEHAGKHKQDIDEHADKQKLDIEGHVDNRKQDIDKHTDKHKQDIDEHADKHKQDIDEHADNRKQDIDTHADKQKQDIEKHIEEHVGKHKQDMDEHADKCKQDISRIINNDERIGNSTCAETDYKQSCEDLRRRLVEHYNDTSSYVSLSTLDQSFDKRLNDIYATPKIHRIDIEEEEKRTKKEQVLKYTEIFYKNDISNRRIYLQGEPGRGKSTFAAKLVQDWCNGHPTSSAASNKQTAFDDVVTILKFNFLFFISLRDSGGQNDVTQMIKTQLIDQKYSEDKRDSIYKLFLQIMETEMCLVVRDGLDEWVAPAGSNLAEPSMAGFPNDKCTVLTTSRPWKLADERIKKVQIDILLEIEGICDPDTFSERILRCIIDKTKDHKETLRNFNLFTMKHELESLSTSPMLYTLVLCTWVDDTANRLTGSSLCALYTTLLESLCKKPLVIEGLRNNAEVKTGYFNEWNPTPVTCFSGTKYLQPNIENIDVISKAACYLLFSSERETSIVFSDIQLSNYVTPSAFSVCKDFALKAGLLSSRKVKRCTDGSYSFIHKSVQEFLAAYHIACNTHVIHDVISKYLSRHEDAYLDISQVLIFLCGLNILAANELSFLMNERAVEHHTRYNYNEFQRITLSAYREAVYNKQTGVQLKLSHFVIHDENVKDLHSIWAMNESNVQSLCVELCGSESSTAIGESASCIEFDLSSCHKLNYLALSDVFIGFRDFSSSATSDIPVWFLLNCADPAQCADSPPVLPSIQYIRLKRVTCSSTWLRSLFNTLLTLGHKVECFIRKCCYITSRGVDSRSNTPTSANITTGCNNTFIELYIDQQSTELWESLHGLNFKSLSVEWDYLKYESSFVQLLPSLTPLETLSIRMLFDRPGLWKALHGLNIKSLCLKVSFGGLEVKHESSLSQSLSSLTQLETLSITVNVDSPVLWEALHSLNIKSLSLSGSWGGLEVKNVSSSSQSLSSLTQLETLRMYLSEYFDLELPRSLKYLNFYYNALSPSQLRDLVNTLSSCTQPVECRLEFGCGHSTLQEFGCDSVFSYLRIDNIPPKEYLFIQHELDTLEHVEVKLFRIYDCDSVVDDFADEVYEKFVSFFRNKHHACISLRLQINGPQGPASTS